MQVSRAGLQAPYAANNLNSHGFALEQRCGSNVNSLPPVIPPSNLQPEENLPKRLAALVWLPARRGRLGSWPTASGVSSSFLSEH